MHIKCFDEVHAIFSLPNSSLWYLNEKCPLRLRDLNTCITVGGVVGKVLDPLGGRDVMGKSLLLARGRYFGYS